MIPRFPRRPLGDHRRCERLEGGLVNFHSFGVVEVLAYQLLTLVPQRSGSNWIEGIGANSLADLINIAHEQFFVTWQFSQ